MAPDDPKEQAGDPEAPPARSYCYECGEVAVDHAETWYCARCADPEGQEP
jgi:hypothetical protein